MAVLTVLTGPQHRNEAVFGALRVAPAAIASGGTTIPIVHPAYTLWLHVSIGHIHTMRCAPIQINTQQCVP